MLYCIWFSRLVFFPEALRLGFPLVVFVASGTAFTSAPGAVRAPPARRRGADYARAPVLHWLAFQRQRRFSLQCRASSASFYTYFQLKIDIFFAKITISRLKT